MAINPDEKYLNDPKYYHFVNMLRAYLRTYEMTPTEIREACMLACTMHEMETVRPIMVANIQGWYPVKP